MNRRTLLGCLVAGTMGLAGCASVEVRDATTTTPTAAVRSPRSTAVETTTAGHTPTPRPTRTEPPTESPTPTEPPTPTPVPERIALISVEAPVRTQLGETVLYRFTVENTGPRTEVFEPTVSVRSGSDDWAVRDRWEPVRLPPGGQHTFEGVPISRDYLGSVDFRIDELEETFSIEFVDRKLALDTVFRDPRNRQVSVVGLIPLKSYSYRTGSGERRSIEAGDGLQWVFVTITVENRSPDPVVTPAPGSFSLLAGLETYRPVDIRDDDEYESVRLPRRETYRGRIGFKTPDTYARGAYQVRWRETFDAGEIGVIWYP